MMKDNIKAEGKKEQVQADGTMWLCWADWEESSHAESQQMTLNNEIVGFEGACTYKCLGETYKWHARP